MSKVISENPIGVFDSGVGGLTVVKEICKIMPREDIVYLGDTARLPYGSKSEKTITKYSLENAIFLHSKIAKIIVIACNTASAVSLEYLNNFIKIPVIGVVGCGSIAAVRATRKKKIGVIGTKATINSGAYTKVIKNIDKNIDVFEIATPLLVHLVEENWVDKDVTREILKEYLLPLINMNIDTLILGCTHYPLLIERINEISKDITIIDSSKETSLYLLNTLKRNKLLKNNKSTGTIKVYLSDPHPNFLNWANKLLKNGCNLEMMDLN